MTPETYRDWAERGVKVCSVCNKEKPLDAFVSQKTGALGRTARCKACACEYQRRKHEDSEAYAQHKDRVGAHRRSASGKATSLKNSASARGLPSAAHEEIAKWLSEAPEVCHYCGETPETAERLLRALKAKAGQGDATALKFLRGAYRRPRATEAYAMTVDRRDSEKGYTIGNMVKACWRCNLIKGAFLTECEMQTIGPSLRARFEKAAGIEG